MAAAASSILVLTAGGVTMEFTASELLTRADARRILVPRDPSYGEAMSYRGVPLPGLLAALPPDSAETIQARAKDGFVAEIPRALISGAAVPWIAIEDASHPWPPLRGKAISAGPFYLVWQYPERASISAEQWVYALAALTAVASPVQRWPTIAVDPTIPGDAPQDVDSWLTSPIACRAIVSVALARRRLGRTCCGPWRQPHTLPKAGYAL
jgi:hypothetical protein